MLTGEGSIDRLGELAKELGFSRTLLVADAGLVKAGHLEHAHASLEAAGVDAIEFSEFGPNPDADMLEAGRRHATGKGIDSIIGLGGGSSLDCAKGINFLLTQGGAIHDFQGYGKAMKPMLPMIGVPTTAGTGSEAQSYAIISDPRTHRKMACGDPKAAFRAVILDPRLTLTQPPSVTAAAGYDAIAHAVESFVCTKRNARSQELSLEAWRLLEANYERVLAAPDDLDGARRDAAGRVSRRHGDRALDAGRHARVREPGDRALRHDARQRHRDSASARRPMERERRQNRCTPSCCAFAHPTTPRTLHQRLRTDAELSRALLSGRSRRSAEDPSRGRRIEGDLRTLASEAAEQWTGTFNPRPFDAMGALEIYECAF